MYANDATVRGLALVSFSFNSAADVRLWAHLQPMFGPVREAWIGMWPSSVAAKPATVAGLHATFADPSPSTLTLAGGDPDDPNLVTLSGCTAGYRGEGARASRDVLVSAGITAPIAELVFTYAVLHLQHPGIVLHSADPAG